MSGDQAGALRQGVCHFKTVGGDVTLVSHDDLVRDHVAQLVRARRLLKFDQRQVVLRSDRGRWSKRGQLDRRRICVVRRVSIAVGVYATVLTLIADVAPSRRRCCTDRGVNEGTRLAWRDDHSDADRRFLAYVKVGGGQQLGVCDAVIRVVRLPWSGCRNGFDGDRRVDKCGSKVVYHRHLIEWDIAHVAGDDVEGHPIPVISQILRRGDKLLGDTEYWVFGELHHRRLVVVGGVAVSIRVRVGVGGRGVLRPVGNGRTIDQLTVGRTHLGANRGAGHRVLERPEVAPRTKTDAECHGVGLANAHTIRPRQQFDVAVSIEGRIER